MPMVQSSKDAKGYIEKVKSPTFEATTIFSFLSIFP